MQKLLNNFIIVIVSVLFLACDIEDIRSSVEHAAMNAKYVCNGKYKEKLPLLKSCQNGVDNAKYVAFNSKGSLSEVKVIEGAKALCLISYSGDLDRYNACLKGIHFIFIHRDMYVVKSQVGEQKSITELAISDLVMSGLKNFISNDINYLHSDNLRGRSYSIPQ